MRIKLKRFCAITLTALALAGAADALAADSVGPSRLVIEAQGSFAAGGKVATAPGTFDPRKPMDPAGQTYHGDHVYAFYQMPANARKYPIVMWHGAGQFSKTWETTPDGREGFQNIFLHRRFAVYLIDQPRRGDAGRSSVGATLTRCRTNSCRSTSSALVFGRTTSRVCSSPAILKR